MILGIDLATPSVKEVAVTAWLPGPPQHRHLNSHGIILSAAMSRRDLETEAA